MQAKSPRFCARSARYNFQCEALVNLFGCVQAKMPAIAENVSASGIMLSFSRPHHLRMRSLIECEVMNPDGQKIYVVGKVMRLFTLPNGREAVGVAFSSLDVNTFGQVMDLIGYLEYKKMRIDEGE